MRKQPTWNPVRLDGERWLSATLSIAPRQLPAFSATWFEVRAAGPLPEWVLFLSAIGIHVYGDGTVLVVQDRPGLTEQHDGFRLTVLAQWIACDTAHPPLALLRDVSSDSDDLGEESIQRFTPREARSAWAALRSALRAGHWDLPAGRGRPGHRMPPTEAGQVRSRPPRSKTARRRREIVPWSKITPELLDRVTKVGWRIAIVSLVLHGAVILFGRPYLSQIEVARDLVTMGVMATALLMLLTLFGPFFLNVLLLTRSIYCAPAPTFISPPDARPRFEQLHDAVCLEGRAWLEAARDAVGLQRYEAHMDEVLRRYRLLTDAPARTEASALDPAHPSASVSTACSRP